MLGLIQAHVQSGGSGSERWPSGSGGGNRFHPFHLMLWMITVLDREARTMVEDILITLLEFGGSRVGDPIEDEVSALSRLLDFFGGGCAQGGVESEITIGFGCDKIWSDPSDGYPVGCSSMSIWFSSRAQDGLKDGGGVAVTKTEYIASQ